MVPTIGTFKWKDSEVRFTGADFYNAYRPWFDLEGFHVHDESCVTDDEVILIMYKTFYEEADYGEIPLEVYFEVKISRKDQTIDFKYCPECSAGVCGYLSMQGAGYLIYDYVRRIQALIDDGMYDDENPNHWHGIKKLCGLCEDLEGYIDECSREQDLFVANF